LILWFGFLTQSRLYSRLARWINIIKDGGVLKSMLTLNEAIIDVKEG